MRKRDFRFAGGDSQVMELTILKYTLVDFVRGLLRTITMRNYNYENILYEKV